MPKYSEETYNLVNIKRIKEKHFNIVKNRYESIEEKNTPKNQDVKVINFYYKENNSFGIFYYDKLVGLITVNPFIEKMIEIRTLVLSEYRGIGIAQVAREKIVELTGNIFNEYEKYISLVNPDNTSSNKSLQNLGWIKTDELNEMMMDEGAEWFNVYYKLNPYYNREKIIRMVNTDDKR